METKSRENKEVILFDGVCNLCSGAVKFIIKRDLKSHFKFASLQSDYAKKRLKELGESTSDLSTLLLIQNGKVYKRSTAALKIAKKLSGLWPGFAVFLLLPKFIRDTAYNFVAAHRYRWFGKKESCMVPGKDTLKRFIEL